MLKKFAKTLVKLKMYMYMQPTCLTPLLILNQLESIGALEEFMLKHQKDYVDMYRTTDQERDNIEHEVSYPLTWEITKCNIRIPLYQSIWK